MESETINVEWQLYKLIQALRVRRNNQWHAFRSRRIFISLPYNSERISQKLRMGLRVCKDKSKFMLQSARVYTFSHSCKHNLSCNMKQDVLQCVAWRTLVFVVVIRIIYASGTGSPLGPCCIMGNDMLGYVSF